MSKDRRVNSSSFERSMVSPYSCSSKIPDHKNSKSSLPHAGDKEEWEEVRCPICMEHPHNAVLLLCSSHEKGCRPFICDTSYRHSNCFDHFSKSSAAANLHAINEQSELVCPLCRGTVMGWNVIHAAREFLNSKTRSCSLEACNFSGNYSDIRKHARLEHPSRRPSEASPRRQSKWRTLEQQRDIEDILVYQSDIEYDFDEWPSFDNLDDYWTGSSEFLSFGDWAGDDVWSGGSFLDLTLGMPDVEDDLSTLGGLSMPFFSPPLSYPPPSHDDDNMVSVNARSGDNDMMSSGNSRSVDQPQWATLTGSRSNVHLEHAVPSLGAGLSYISEDNANVTTSLSRSRSDHHRDNGRMISSSRSSYQRAGYPAISRSRWSYHRADDPASSRSRSSYSRVNYSNTSRSSYLRASGTYPSRSRSRYYREIGPESSRRRSTYLREREHRNLRLWSRPRSRFHGRGDFVPPAREYGTRRSPGFSRQLRSNYDRRGD